MDDQYCATLKFYFCKALDHLWSDEVMIKAVSKRKDEEFREIFSIKIQQIVLDFIGEDRGFYQFYLQNTDLVNESTNRSIEMFLDEHKKMDGEN